MKTAILGTGAVAKAFAKRLAELKHPVMLGTRDPLKTLESRDEGSMQHFLAAHPAIRLGTFAEAAAWGDQVINASKGSAALKVIKSAGAENLRQKVIIDVTNPLDFSKGFPPFLIPEFSNTTSLAEEIQKMVPEAKVVKTLNTMWNGIMVNPGMIAGGDHVNYICGNHADAKQQVLKLLSEFGWKSDATLDIGDLSGARATEATLPIWLRVYGAKKSGAFNFRIVS